MSEISVTPGRGFAVVLSGPGGSAELRLTEEPDDTYARIDLIYRDDAKRIGVIVGTPGPPPLTVPETPEGAEVLAGVLVRPVYIASGDIIKPEKLAEV